MNDFFPKQDDRLAELLLAWEDSVAAGHPLSAEALCRDCPELAGEVEREIDHLKAIDRFLFSGSNRAANGMGDASVSSGANSAAAIPRFPSVPGYEILEEVGKGGMGVVYKARQQSLGRLVAVKSLAGSRWGQPGFVARLRQEAQALSRLNDPNVVQVIDVVETADMVSLVLEYVEGSNLSKLQAGAPLSVSEAARLAQTLAQTLARVHAAGLLHRDIKPANVLIDRVGAIKLTDFGLAKEAGTTDGLTVTGDVLGSPGYMAPEQALGRNSAIDVRTDVYGLGATLYEMLTGRPPFVGESLVETLDQVRGHDPVAPRLMNPGVSRDVETICLKCLEKEPSRRFATAHELADELRRFLQGEPIRSRPISTISRGLRWLKRHPAQAVVTGTIVAALAAVISVSTWYTVRLSGAERETDLKKQSLDAEIEKGRLQNFNLLAARIRERSLNRPRGWSVDNLSDLKQLGNTAGEGEARRMLRGEALRALCASGLELVGTVVENFDNYGLAYSPDGRWLAAGVNRSDDGVGIVVLFDADTRQEIRRLTFEPPAPAAGGKTALEGIRSLLFSPDGRRLFVGSRTGMIHVWDVEANRQEQAWHAHADFVVGLGLIAEADVLATLSEDATLRFWKLPAGQLLESIDFKAGNSGKAGKVSDSLAVSGDRVFLVYADTLVEHRFDRDAGQARHVWSSFVRFGRQVALFPDQRTILSLGQVLMQHQLTGGAPVRRFFDPRHDQPQLSQHDLDVATCGRWAASCSYEGIQLWDAVSGLLIQTLRNSANQRVSAAFRPGGREIAVAREGRVEVWQITASGVWESELRQSYPVEYADLSADGRTLVGATMPRDSVGHVRERDYLLVAESGSRQCGYPKQFVAGFPINISSDGRFVVCTGHDGTASTLELCEVGVPESRQLISRQRNQKVKVAFSADQQHVWYANCDVDRVGYLACCRLSDCHEEFRWLNERSEREIQRSLLFSIAVGAAAVAASSVDETIRFFDPATGQPVREILLRGRTVDALCLTADEKSLVCGTREGRLLVLNMLDGRTLVDMAAHDDWITAVCASADGLVFTACRDGTLAAWQCANGQLRELFRLGPLSHGVKDAVISRDGKLLMILVESETGVRLLKIDVLRRRLEELGLDW